MNGLNGSKRLLGWATKALGRMTHSGAAPLFFGFLRRTKFDYAREVGSGLDSSVVTAPIHWVQRSLPEARFIVQRERRDGRHEEVSGHGLTALIRRPNRFYSTEVLWAATALSYLLAGNAYWLIVRDGNGRPVELWWAPHWSIEPKWPADGSAFISRYDYSPGGPTQQLNPEDVVHFRHGLDPNNPRLGLSPIAAVLREVFMDIEASNFVASLAKNIGVPGVVVAPKEGKISVGDVQQVKAWLKEAFTGDSRGEPLVMGAPTDVHQYGFNPQQMDLSAVRDVAEERVCAAIGINVAVVGFGSGNQSIKVGATLAEMRRLAWVNGVLPILRVFAGEISRSLLPAFPGRGRLEAGFDLDRVAALVEDDATRANRWDTMVQGGWAEVAEAREGMGLTVDESHRIFLRPSNAFQVRADDSAAGETGGGNGRTEEVQGDETDEADEADRDQATE